MLIRKSISYLLVLFCCSMFSACGGGGGSGSGSGSGGDTAPINTDCVLGASKIGDCTL